MLARWWFCPAVIEISASVLAVLVLADINVPGRALVAFWFLTICPGWAWVQLFNIEDVWASVTLSIALSLAMDVAVTTTLVYEDHYTPMLALAILIEITIVGVGLKLFFDTRHEARALTPVTVGED